MFFEIKWTKKTTTLTVWVRYSRRLVVIYRRIELRIYVKMTIKKRIIDRKQSFWIYCFCNMTLLYNQPEFIINVY